MSADKEPVLFMIVSPINALILNNNNSDVRNEEPVRDNTFRREGDFDRAFSVAGIGGKAAIDEVSQNKFVAEKILNNKTTNVSNLYINDLLFFMGYSKEEIEANRRTINDDALFNGLVYALNAISTDTNSFSLSWASLTDPSLPKNKRNSFENIKIINEKNINELEKYTGDRNSAINALWALVKLSFKNVRNLDKIFAASLDIYEVCDGELKDIIEDMRFPEKPELFTKERLKAYKTFADEIGIKLDYKKVKYLDNPNAITPEFVQEYKKVITELEKQNIEINKKNIVPSVKEIQMDCLLNDPVSSFAVYSEVLEKMKKHKLDFSWYKSDNFEFYKKIPLNKILELLDSENLDKISAFLQKVDENVKLRYPKLVFSSLSNNMCLNDVDGYVSLCNTISKIPVEDGTFNNFLEVLPKYSQVDFNGMNKVAQAFLTAGVYPAYYNEDYPLSGLDKNGKYNYDGLAKFIRNLSEFYGSKDSEFSIADYMSMEWRYGNYDKVDEYFKKLNDFGLKGKVEPADLRCLFLSGDESLLDKIIKFNDNPVFRSNAEKFQYYDIEQMEKAFAKFDKFIKDINPECSNLTPREIEKIMDKAPFRLQACVRSFLETGFPPAGESDFNIANVLGKDMLELLELVYIKNAEKFSEKQGEAIIANFHAYKRGKDSYADSCVDYAKELLKSDLPSIEIIERIDNRYTCDKAVKLHRQLLKDAFENRDVLKNGIADLPDGSLRYYMNRKETVKALNLLGKGNLEAAFSSKINGFNDLCDEISEFDISPENREKILQKINPIFSKKYQDLAKSVAELKSRLINLLDEDTVKKVNSYQAQKRTIDFKKSAVSEQMRFCRKNSSANLKLKKQFKELQKNSKILGGKIQTLYLTSGNHNEIKKVLNDIKLKNSEINELLRKSSEFKPQDVVDKIRVLTVINSAKPEEISRFIDLLKPSSAFDDARWNYETNNILYDLIGVESDDVLNRKLDLIHSKYLSKLVISLTKNDMRITHSLYDFKWYLKKLVNIIKGSPNLSVEETIDNLSQNKETKEIFSSIGIDYDKWTKRNPDSVLYIKIKLDSEKSKKAVIHSLTQDLVDDLFKVLPQEIQDEIMEALAKIGVTIESANAEALDISLYSVKDNCFYCLFKDGRPITFDDLKQVISCIKNTINANEFWTKNNPDKNIEQARGTLYDHFVTLLKNRYSVAQGLKNNDTANLKIAKTDMYNVSKALGLGNDSQCCTALGGLFNEYTAPTYIMNKCIGAIELTDDGSFVGNTMVYIANVDGEPSLVLDNIELKSKYAFNDEIRNGFVEYAKKLCEEIGRPDLPIYAGPKRHKLNMTVFPCSDRLVKLLGSSGTDELYLDFDASAHIIDRDRPQKCLMYKIR